MANETVLFFRDELARALSNALRTPIVVGAPSHSVLGAVILMQIRPTSVTTRKDILAVFDDAMQRTDVVQSHWQLDGDIFLRVGRDPLRSMRTDRGAGSRVHGADFAEPFNSLRRLRLIKLVISATSMPSASASPIQLDYELDLASQFLQFALRLNPHDIASVLGLEAKATTESCRTAAVSALSLPTELNCLDDARKGMHDMSLLATLVETMPQLFALNSQLKGTHGVLFHFDSETAQCMTRHNLPSYFMDWPKSIRTRCQAQVHVPDCQIATLGNCHLVFFTTSPSPTEIETVTTSLKAFLQAGDCRVLSTEPFRCSTNSTMFNTDGGIQRQALDKILSPLAKTALSLRARGSIARDVTMEVTSLARKPVTKVIWTRQSEDDTTATTSISRQVWTALTSGAPPLVSVHPQDRLVIVVEYCSSSKHPWFDRQLRSMLPTDRPLEILTCNPDRLTRRADEVEPILNELVAANGSWYSQGAGFGELPAETWFDVSQDIEFVKEQIRCGRQRAIQLGFYSRSVMAMTRFVEAEEADPNDVQVVSLQGFLRVAVEVHAVRCVIIIVRDSPPRGEQRKEARNASTSLARQKQFLKAALKQVNVEIKFLSLPHTSAYSDATVVETIGSELETCTGKTMLVTSALDRTVRSTENYQGLKKLLLRSDHLALSLLWDGKTIESSAVRSWASALSLQDRAAESSRNLPLVQPIIWISSTLSARSPLTDHIARHLTNAEEFVASQALSAYQGERALEIPREITIDTGRTWTKERKEQWTEFIQNAVPIELSIIIPLGRNETWDCSRATVIETVLVSKGTVTVRESAITHGEDDASRLCATPRCTNLAPTDRKNGRFCGSCVRGKAKSKPCDDAASTVKQCIEDDCTNPAQTGGAGGKRCGPCYQKRKAAQTKTKRDSAASGSKRTTMPCKTTGCTGQAEQGSAYGKFCRRCYLDRDNEKRTAKKAAKRRA
ncbi:hypothetical protein LTR56_008717 [Elasticomyces elasticus]|nr:hypothetical protein LTR56_008717 [Elasticomyces elasticus]KAK4924281.1 hypothetical protein LTR49_008581 [Elasticomyces elasticus]